MFADKCSEITQILKRIQADGDSNYDVLRPLLYDELRSMAGAYLRQERLDHTLQPTALVRVRRSAISRDGTYRGIAAQSYQILSNPLATNTRKRWARSNCLAVSTNPGTRPNRAKATMRSPPSGGRRYQRLSPKMS